MNDFHNTTAAVIGLARAGVPSARFLLERGARVVGYDAKERAQVGEDVLALEAAGVELRLGEHGFAGIEACDLVVLSPGLKVHFEPLRSVIEAVEARGGEVIGELELASRFCPCPIIGVTGTKGKSTTVKLITEMLLACGVRAVSAGNTGTPLISVLPQLDKDSWAVVEVSSFQLEKAPTFKPKIAVLLSLLEDHQDYHPTLEQYWETKLRIFANQGEGDTTIFNVDDPRVLSHFLRDEKSDLPLATTCRALEEVSELKWWQGVGDKEFDTLPWVWGDSSREFLHLFAYLVDLRVSLAEFPLKGTHNISNLAAALGAVALVVHLGPNGFSFPEERKQHLNAIQEIINNFQSLPHRLEVVATKDGVTYVNDSQSTIPDASIAALRAFPSPVSLLLGGRAKIGAESYAALMREVARSGAKIFLFGEAAGLLEEVAHRENVENFCIYRENTLSDALQLVKMNSTSGETVVLSPACASFDQFSSYEERGETFRRLVRAL